jgi:hypothetical protein
MRPNALRLCGLILLSQLSFSQGPVNPRIYLRPTGNGGCPPGGPAQPEDENVVKHHDPPVNDYLMEKYRWVDDQGNDLEVEAWRINDKKLPFWSERVSQSKKDGSSTVVISPGEEMHWEMWDGSTYVKVIHGLDPC